MIETLYTIFVFIVVLSVVVFVHEYGHYIVGRWCGIKAETFSLGMGPSLGGWTDRHGTRWQVAAIPLGGYVKFVGDTNAASAAGPNGLSNVVEQGQENSLIGASLWRRALTVAAGPFANFLLSIVVFAGLVFHSGIAPEELKLGSFNKDPIGLQIEDRIIGYEGQAVESYNDFFDIVIEDSPEGIKTYTVEREGQQIDVDGPYPFPALIGGVQPLSAAANAGLLPNDEIVEYNGVEIASFDQLRTTILDLGAVETSLVVLRDGERAEFQIKPQIVDYPAEGGGFEKRVMLGVSSAAVFERFTESPSLYQAVRIGVLQTQTIITGSVEGLYLIATGQLGADNLQGPVGIARASADRAESGLIELIGWIGLISTAIGFINLFPIPVLDGGHLVLYAYEAIRGKPPQERIASALTAGGLSLMLCLMVFATYNDVLRLLNA